MRSILVTSFPIPRDSIYCSTEFYFGFLAMESFCLYILQYRVLLLTAFTGLFSMHFRIKTTTPINKATILSNSHFVSLVCFCFKEIGFQLCYVRWLRGAMTSIVLARKNLVAVYLGEVLTDKRP